MTLVSTLRFNELFHTDNLCKFYLFLVIIHPQWRSNLQITGIFFVCWSAVTVAMIRMGRVDQSVALNVCGTGSSWPWASHYCAHSPRGFTSGHSLSAATASFELFRLHFPWLLLLQLLHPVKKKITEASTLFRYQPHQYILYIYIPKGILFILCTWHLLN